jgi:ABC-type iron transport system FetAB ATPase subunit
MIYQKEDLLGDTTVDNAILPKPSILQRRRTRTHHAGYPALDSSIAAPVDL